MDIILFITGLILLIKGSFRVLGRSIEKSKGRLIGFLLMIPGILSFMLGIVVAARNPMATSVLEMYDEQTLVNMATIVMGAMAIAIGASLYISLSQPKTPQMMQTIERYSDVMTITEAAGYLRISEADVRMLIDTDRLPAARIGGDYRIARRAVDDFLRLSGSQTISDL